LTTPDSSRAPAERGPAARGSVLYSAVIPVYNSADSLPELAKRLNEVLSRIAPEQYEVLYIDDASPDGRTWDVLKQIAAQYPRMRAIRLTRNFGRYSAIMCGFDHAAGHWIITMDDDLQHRPEDIPALLSEREHDAVVARFTTRRDSRLVRLMSRWRHIVENVVLGKPRHIVMSPFCMFKSDVARMMRKINTPYPYPPALLFYVTQDVVNVETAHEERRFGRSNIDPWRRIKIGSNLLINNSALLLRVVAAVGIGFASLSFLLAAYIIGRYVLIGTGVIGWTSLMTVTLLVGGVVLLSIGVVGEYLIRIIHGIEGRPDYFVRDGGIIPDRAVPPSPPEK
jgi:glycosyltransferase involved in cell wall biosynthesis